MNSGYWTGVPDSERPLQFSALFLIKWLRTNDVRHSGRVKIHHLNIKQHKTILDFCWACTGYEEKQNANPSFIL